MLRAAGSLTQCPRGFAGFTGARCGFRFKRERCFPRCLPAEDICSERGLSVRVQHPTQLNVDTELLWRVLREELPNPQAWNDVAVVLASLESLYRFEYLLAAEEAVAAFNSANAAEVPLHSNREAAKQEKQPWFRRRRWQEQQQQQQQQQEQQQKKKKQSPQSSQAGKLRGQGNKLQQQAQQFGRQGREDGESSATATAAAVFDAAATAAAVAAAATGANNIMQQQQQQQEPPLSPEDKMRLVAQQRDRELADWVLFLASHSHFQALSRRDCEIARTLNQGYLAQLFIQSDASTLDGGVVQAFEQQAGSSVLGPAEEAASRHAWDASLGNGSKSTGLSGLMQSGREAGGEGLVTDGGDWGADASGNGWSARNQGSSSSSSVRRRGNGWSKWSGSGSAVGRSPSSGTTGEGAARHHEGGEGFRAETTDQEQHTTNQTQSTPSQSSQGEHFGPGERSPGSSVGSESSDASWAGRRESDTGDKGPSSSVDSSVPPGIGCALPISQTGLSKAESEVMEDAGMLIFKRGFGREQVRGRLILAKLDFLQTALVEELLESVRSTIQELLRKSKQSASRLLESQRNQDEERKRSQRDYVPSMYDKLTDRLTESASRAIIWLSERGVAPITDVLQLWELDELHPLREPARLSPLKLRVVGLKEILGAKSILQQDFRELTRLLLQPTELEEPTFEEIAVLYRRKPRQQRRGFWGRLRNSLSRAGQKLRLIPPSPPGPSTATRPPINLQIYKDVPLPTWQVVLPEKILQFRPLDFLRTDLFAVAGLIALFAQARYDSLYLELVTGVSAIVFLVRIFLGFQRMEQRYRVRLSEVLREKTVATDTTALEYLAASAASQQFKQAALAYVLLLQQQQQQQQQHHHHYHHHQWHGQGNGGQGHYDESSGNVKARSTNGVHSSNGQRAGSSAQSSVQQPGVGGLEGLAARAEHLLLQRCGLKVRFDVEQAMAELLRQGLVRAEAPPTATLHKDAPVLVQQGSSSASSSSRTGSWHAQEEQQADTVSNGANSSSSIHSRKMAWDVRDWRSKGQRVEQRDPPECTFCAVEPAVALTRVEQQWRSILWQRVDGQLRRVQHRMTGGQ